MAGVGLDERQAEAAGIDFEVSKLNLDQVPRAVAARDTRGFIKLLRDRATDRLIGARILAPEGSELLMEVALAIKYGIAVKELASIFHPYQAHIGRLMRDTTPVVVGGPPLDVVTGTVGGWALLRP